MMERIRLCWHFKEYLKIPVVSLVFGCCQVLYQDNDPKQRSKFKTWPPIYAHISLLQRHCDGSSILDNHAFWIIWNNLPSSLKMQGEASLFIQNIQYTKTIQCALHKKEHREQNKNSAETIKDKFGFVIFVLIQSIIKISYSSLVEILLVFWNSTISYFHGKG